MTPRRRRAQEQRERIAERNDVIVELTRRGWSAERIAEKLGITPRTVARVRVRSGVALPKPPLMTGDELEMARALLEDGWSYNETGRRLGRHAHTLSRHLPGYGWSHEDSGRYLRMVLDLRAL